MKKVIAVKLPKLLPTITLRIFQGYESGNFGNNKVFVGPIKESKTTAVRILPEASQPPNWWLYSLPGPL